MNVSIFSYREHDIDVTNRNGYLAYTFHHNGEVYGFKIETGRKTADIVNHTAGLLLNAVETINKLLDNPKTDDK